MKNKFLSTLALQSHYVKNAIYIARHYLRWPYHIERHQEYGDHDHEHTCLATHLPNVKLTDVCPMAGRKFRVGLEDDCERCPYFCVIRYEKDAKTGKKAIRFYMSEEIVTTYVTR